MRVSRLYYFSGLLVMIISIGQAHRSDAQTVAKFHAGSAALSSATARVNPEQSGIHEIVEDKYQKRYQEWKAEFLSTEIGRAQWELYSHNPHFSLTITIAKENSHGGGSGKYIWDENGQLAGATITLGTRIDEGYPSSVYYPVMNALEAYEEEKLLDGNVLAEIGRALV